MLRRGFTVVEIIITITIMGILLTLAVVSLSASQITSRDNERKSDVESIAVHLEIYYDNDSSNSAGEAFMSGGTYPGTSYIDTDSMFQRILVDIDPKSTRAPGVSPQSPKSLVSATTATEGVSTITPRPSSSQDVYVYQPLTRNNLLCTDPSLLGPSGDSCRKFNLYYWQESDNTVKMVTSKYQ